MITLLPVAYDPSVSHPAWAGRFERSALGDDFATPGDALRRMRWLRDNGHNCVVPQRYHLGFISQRGY